MGGSIFVESTLGEGATFSLDLTFESSESCVAGRDRLDLADVVVLINPDREILGLLNMPTQELKRADLGSKLAHTAQATQITIKHR